MCEKKYSILALKNINWSLFVSEIKSVNCTVSVLSLNRSDYIPFGTGILHLNFVTPCM